MQRPPAGSRLQGSKSFSMAVSTLLEVCADPGGPVYIHTGVRPGVSC